MKTSLVIAALAAALITGSTVSSQAIPAAPLSKASREQFLSRRNRRISRVPWISRSSACRRLSRLPPCRPLPGLPGYRRVGLYRRLWIPRLPACRHLRIQGLPRLPLGRRCSVSQPRLLVKPLPPA